MKTLLVITWKASLMLLILEAKGDGDEDKRNDDQFSGSLGITLEPLSTTMRSPFEPENAEYEYEYNFPEVPYEGEIKFIMEAPAKPKMNESHYKNRSTTVPLLPKQPEREPDIMFYLINEEVSEVYSYGYEDDGNAADIPARLQHEHKIGDNPVVEVSIDRERSSYQYDDSANSTGAPAELKYGHKIGGHSIVEVSVERDYSNYQQNDFANSTDDYTEDVI